MKRLIRIGSRKSALAVAQTELVVAAMKQAAPDMEFELVLKQTQGDRILDRPLLAFGGKGVFVSEFEQALLDHEIDFAVHSAKDLPMDLAKGLEIVGTPKREDPRDVLITRRGTVLNGMYEIVIGTSSLRRKIQIERLGTVLWGNAKVRCENLRGNVQTRLRKLDEGEFDGILLAAAGIKRLGLHVSETYDYHYFNCEDFIPSGGQGIIAIEGRTGDAVNEIACTISDEDAKQCLTLEREILRLLEAGCHEPVGIYSCIDGDSISVTGIYQTDDTIKQARGKRLLRETIGLAQEIQKQLQ